MMGWCCAQWITYYGLSFSNNRKCNTIFIHLNLSQLCATTPFKTFSCNFFVKFYLDMCGWLMFLALTKTQHNYRFKPSFTIITQSKPNQANPMHFSRVKWHYSFTNYVHKWVYHLVYTRESDIFTILEESITNYIFMLLRLIIHALKGI